MPTLLMAAVAAAGTVGFTGAQPQARSACAHRDALRADIDGDGRTDLVYHVFVRDHAVLGVCTASGRDDRIAGSGMAEVLKIIDIQPDHRDEIFYGATTVASEDDEIAVFLDGALRQVRLAGGGPLEVVRGLDPGFLAHDGRPAGGAFGCEDTNRDGRDELVQVVVQRSRGAFRWVKRAYAITGAVARRTTTTSGRVRARRGSFALAAAARRLTRACAVKASNRR